VRAALTALVSIVAVVVASVPAGQAPDRTRPPALGPAPALELPPIQKQALSNGLPVWIVEMHEVPVADVTLVVKSGAAADPSGKFGLASFTAAMLDEGAGSLGALELADAVDFLGASVSTGSSYDVSSVRLHTPVSRLDAALPLMADVARRPTFADSELERLKQERLTSLLQTRDNPGALAAVAFSRTLYGPRHRYGTPIMGNDASNGEMTASDLRSFHTAHYQPQNSHLLVVGDVSPAAVMPMLERAFGGWANAGAVPGAALAAAPQPGARQIYLVDKPGSPQAQIRIGAIGVARSTADYYVLDVMNTILGGSFSSRLNMNLREEHGYSYGAASSFEMRLAPGPFSARAGVQTDKTVESLREFFNELEEMHALVPDDELTRARNLEALGFPASFESTAGMAGNLAELVVYGLPETFFTDYVQRILAVTAADVQRAAREYLRSDRFAVVVVGDLATIEQPIRQAKLGPVTVLAVDEVLK
jgi:predicted Zn-dependent peptidase